MLLKAVNVIVQVPLGDEEEHQRLRAVVEIGLDQVSESLCIESCALYKLLTELDKEEQVEGAVQYRRTCLYLLRLPRPIVIASRRAMKGPPETWKIVSRPCVNPKPVPVNRQALLEKLVP